jgi:alginate O-acetyltransferase complex protein AlgJ
MAARTLFSDPPHEAVERAPALVPARTWQDVLLSVLFLVLLALPALTNALHIDTTVAGGENRELAPFPTVEATWSSIRSFGSRFESYFKDHFGFRTRLIRAHALLDAEVLHVSPSPTVLWGQNGWLYYADDGATEDIIADKRLTDAELETWRKTLVDDRDWLRARGIEYVFTLAPDKHAIYPEHLPPTIHRLGSRSMMDQLAGYLRAHTDLAVVDLKTPLLAAKAHERVYDLTDTHWNRRGAYVGYRAIMDAVAARVPGVEAPWPATDFRPVQNHAHGQDLAGMLGLSDVISEEELTLVPLRPRRARVIEPANPSPNGDEGYLVTEIAGSTLPKAVVFRDSFTSRLIPFLSEHFSRTVYLWQNDMDPAVVLKEHPAVVIHEIVGRHLTSLVPYEYEAVRQGLAR